MPAPDVAMGAELDPVATLLRDATDRQPMTNGAGKSGAVLERLRIGGRPHVLKYLDVGHDWTMRAAGVLGGASMQMWRRGLLHRLPDCFEQPIVAVASGLDGVTAVLMRDVGEWLVPVTDEVVPLAQHLRFLDHMAALHGAFWQAGPEIDVVPAMHRYLELSPWTAETEAHLGSEHLVPRLIGQGWPLLAEVAPRASAVVEPLARDPSELVAALDATPQTLVHGNLKLDNLGSMPDGRTVLLDWELPGRGAPTSDLAWYLAINCRRLPQTKPECIDTYRAALERHGVRTEPWWERQLALSLLGALVQFGWEKAFGGYDDELRWWEQQALAGGRLLG